MRSAGQRHKDRERAPRRHAILRGGRPNRASGWQMLRGGLAVVALGLTVTGCDGLLQSDELPPGIPDPAITLSRQGALAMYRGTQAAFRNGFGNPFISIAGVLSDELGVGGAIVTSTTALGAEDARSLVEFTPIPASDAAYSDLQRVRGQAGQAISLLTRYAREDSVLAGHVYALQGYTEVFLAELFCSGIPLSTLELDGDFTYQAGSTTTQVLTHAVALFDSALARAGDSARFVALAQIGKARALLGLGAFAQAAVAVATVPDTYNYRVSYASTVPTGGDAARNFAFMSLGSWTMNVSDLEGGNGLNYRTAGDPRVVIVNRGTAATGAIWHPSKYATDGGSPIVLASGVEARLIEAEAALRANPEDGVWLAKLNALRTGGLETIPAETLRDTLGLTGCSATQKCGTDGVSGGTFPDRIADRYRYALTDSVTITLTAAQTTRCRNASSYAPCFESPATSLVRVYVRTDRWSVGSGGYTDLPLLTDPGTPEGRVDLLFRERAFWLFLTGHRQGDLRRLLRHYPGRDQGQLYPAGPYLHSVIASTYGVDVDAPIPNNERLSNPLFTGCTSRGE